MDTSQTLFLMHIMDGYSFRNTIGIIKSETEHATMIVSEKSIEISFMNTSKCAVHKIILYPQEFTMYRYNIRDQDGNLYKEYAISFETNEMFNTTTGIGRRYGIRLYWLNGDNKINVQPIKMSTKDPGRAGALFVKILTMECARYDVGTYNPEPNVRVQAKDFADLCSQANTLKCTSLDIIGQRNSVTFKGILANQTMASINKFVSQTETPKTTQSASNIDEIDMLLDNLRVNDTHMATTGLILNIVKSEDLMTVKVPIATVKALSKIHNISPAGTLLRFYFAEGKPTKLESPIGTYGLYTIGLRNTRG
jgi:hypothetical protein